MAVSDTSEEGSPSDHVELTDEEEDDTGVQIDELEERKQELEKLCGVLGISYKKKLSEFGSKVDKDRVDEVLNFLRITEDENFRELKMISEELVKEWKASNAPLRKMTTISWIMCIRDSATADDVRGQNFLSLAFLNRARKELSDLRKERKKKFTARRKKLIKMLEELHLTKAHVQYEENNPGSVDEYISETRKLKDIIRRLKSDFADRKELILRMEMIKQGIDNGWHLDDIGGLIKKAEDYANEIGGDAETMPYDEGYVAGALRKLQEAAINAATEKSKLTAGLRSGNVYKK